MGKNVFTEIKCHSLLPLDDVTKMVCHNDTIPEIKDAAARNSEEEEAAAKPMFSHHDHEEVPAQLLTSNNAENQFQVSLLQTSAFTMI